MGMVMICCLLPGDRGRHFLFLEHKNAKKLKIELAFVKKRVYIRESSAMVELSSMIEDGAD